MKEDGVFATTKKSKVVFVKEEGQSHFLDTSFNQEAFLKGGKLSPENEILIRRSEFIFGLIKDNKVSDYIIYEDLTVGGFKTKETIEQLARSYIFDLKIVEDGFTNTFESIKEKDYKIEGKSLIITNNQVVLSLIYSVKNQSEKTKLLDALLKFFLEKLPNKVIERVFLGDLKLLL